MLNEWTRAESGPGYLRPGRGNLACGAGVSDKAKPTAHGISPVQGGRPATRRTELPLLCVAQEELDLIILLFAAKRNRPLGGGRVCTLGQFPKPPHERGLGENRWPHAGRKLTRPNGLRLSGAGIERWHTRTLAGKARPNCRASAASAPTACWAACSTRKEFASTVRGFSFDGRLSLLQTCFHPRLSMVTWTAPPMNLVAWQTGNSQTPLSRRGRWRR